MRRRGLLLGLAAFVLEAPLAVGWPGYSARAQGARAGADALMRMEAPSSRDAVWRAIFARPDKVPHPPDNPANAAKVALGHDLFRDPRLSGDGRRSCATCHDPRRGFSDGRPKGEGRSGASLARNVPSLFNLAWGQHFFWDGRASSLEAQALVPLLGPEELAGDIELIVSRLGRDAGLSERFRRAFPETPEIGEATLLKSIAAYERTIVSPETRFDRWVEGDDGALGEPELAGFALFVGKAGCVACHGGWRFTDDAFHDIGLLGPDPGRGAVPGGVPGLAEFKTPGLRELKGTAPYMHDGSLASLRAVVDHYAGGLAQRPSLAANIVRGLTLTEAEKGALVAFLVSLSSDTSGPEN